MARAVLVLAVATALLPACYQTHHYSHVEERAGTEEAAALEVAVGLPAGGVHVRSAPVGVLYRAALTYCRSHFAPRLDRASSEGTTTLRVGLKRRRREGEPRPPGEERNELDLLLGSERPIGLDLDLGAGRHRLDLGGLLLARVRIAAGTGPVAVAFDRPAAEPLGTLQVVGGDGSVRIGGLGHASPAETILAGSGDFELDLSGPWTREARMRVEVPVGDVGLRVPRALPIEVRAPGRDAADLILPGFQRFAGGRYVHRPDPGAPPRVVIEVGAGLGSIAVALGD